jgi:hypothetical protein
LLDMRKRGETELPALKTRRWTIRWKAAVHDGAPHGCRNASVIGFATASRRASGVRP